MSYEDLISLLGEYEGLGGGAAGGGGGSGLGTWGVAALAASQALPAIISLLNRSPRTFAPAFGGMERSNVQIPNIYPGQTKYRSLLASYLKR